MTDGWHTDHTTARFQEWIDAHPKPVLTDHEQAALDRAFDVPDHLQLKRTWLRDFGEDY